MEFFAYVVGWILGFMVCYGFLRHSKSKLLNDLRQLKRHELDAQGSTWNGFNEDEDGDLIMYDDLSKLINK